MALGTERPPSPLIATMAYQIDFLPVGDGQKSGDAIALRFGNLTSEQFVMVIDGGTKDAGERLCEHIRTHYGTGYVDLVVSTHPDADHAGGLTVVLEQMEVGRLWMHRPWLHAADIKELFRSGRLSTSGLRESLQRALQNAHDLEQLAQVKRIPIDEPFAGAALPFGNLGVRVLSPTEARYQSLLPHFRETPVPRHAPGAFQRMVGAATEAVRWLAESMNIETLVDAEVGDTSAENETSVVLVLQIDGHQMLFTGDAGVLALSDALQRAGALGVNLSASQLIQVPHHGSKRNVGPTVLDQLVGRKNGGVVTKSAYVSAAKEGTEVNHPSRKVVNAFKRRGAEVYATQGKTILHSHNSPRQGWGPVSPLPFYDRVED